MGWEWVSTLRYRITSIGTSTIKTRRYHRRLIFIKEIPIMKIPSIYWDRGLIFPSLSDKFLQNNSNVINCGYVMTWKCFFVFLAFVNGIRRSPEDSPPTENYKGGASCFPYIKAWTKCTTSSRVDGHLRRWCDNSVMAHRLFNTLGSRQNGRHFANDILKYIFLNENIWILLQISLKFVPKVQVNNIAALVQIMAWRQPIDKPLSEPMMVSLLSHICVIRL